MVSVDLLFRKSETYSGFLGAPKGDVSKSKKERDLGKMLNVHRLNDLHEI
jgi:hypothetical protein